MNSIGLNAFAAAALLLVAPITVFGATSDEQTILDLERQVSAASASNDIRALDEIVADDYIGIEAIGNTENKAQWFDSIKTRALIVEAEEPSQMRVRLYGNVAVVNGHLSIHDQRNGKAGHHEVAFTDVWVKRDGRWQYVNYQGTMLPPNTATAASESTPPSVPSPAEFAAISPADAQWMRDPSSGLQIATLWGAPQADAAGGELYRFEPGYASPEHTHPFHERAVVTRGTFVILRPGKTPHRLGPGGYFFVPANSLHATRCEGSEPCELYNEVISPRL